MTQILRRRLIRTGAVEMVGTAVRLSAVKSSKDRAVEHLGDRLMTSNFNTYGPS